MNVAIEGRSEERCLECVNPQKLEKFVTLSDQG